MDDIATYPSVAIGGFSDRVPAFGDSDSLGIFGFLKGVCRRGSEFFEGIVVTYNPSTHSASVLIGGAQSIWTCVISDELLSYSFGFSETHPPREGDLVLVLSIAQGAHAGIIVGRIPYAWCFKGKKGDLYEDPDKYHRRCYTQDDEELRTWDRNIPCFMAPLKDKNNDSTHIATHFRPTDVIPGEFAHVNQHNCGIKGGLFSATLLGGGAQLRMSALSNMARLTCETYKRFSMLGSMHEFHNGRYVSSERNVAMYQEERLGGNEIGAEVWTDDATAPVGLGNGQKGENQTMRPRLKELSGFFGHISSKFALRPDPDESSSSIRVQGEAEPKEEGVARETIDPSGQYRLSAAGMIAIERTGRIPVPVRNCYPTDKDHDIPSEPETLEPFEHSGDDPAYRQLELFDRQAYDLKNQYSRVDGLGIKDSDYDVPQEEELKPLNDEYDPHFFGNETVKLEKYDKRRAGAYMGEDGSIIIRDAWGSEIVMLGGNITLSCAGNIQILPGKTALTLAGDDIVHKAQNSVDIHASAHDVRLSAARNMEIVGGGDEEKYSGGVIIESRGKGISAWDGEGDETGESVPISGITIRTKEQGVVIDGKRLNIRSRKDTRIISGDEELDGYISIASKIIRARADSTVIMSKTGESSVMVGKRSAAMLAGSAIVAGSRSAAIINRTKIPILWEDMGANVAEDILPDLEEATQDLSNEKDASAGFDHEALAKMVFNFRTSEQCGTGTGQSWTIGSSGYLKMYEPAWVQVMKIYETLKSGGVDAKPYEEKAEWENGKPWPGKEAEDSAQYAQLSGLKPKNLTEEGFNKSRKNVEKESDIEEKSLKENYLIRK